MARAIHWDEDLSTGHIAWSGGRDAFLGEPLEGDGRAAWEARVHPADLTRVQAYTHRLRAGHTTQWSGEYRISTAHGWRTVREQLVLVEANGAPARIVGTIRDVRPAPELPDSERRFATFVEQLPLLAWEADADGWLDFYNQRWFEYTGTTLEQMEGWGWARVHHAEDLPRMLRVWRSSLETGLPWEDTFRLRRVDGLLRWHLARAFPLRNSAGQVVRWFGCCTDVHEQRLALEEREKLLQAERLLRNAAEAAMREKDEFIAVVSHELRTPLSNVLTRTQLLRRGLDETPLDSALGKIEHNARRLQRLIEDLLDTSSIMSGKLEIGHEIVDVCRAARHAIEAVVLDARKRNIKLELQTPPSAVVLGASGRVEQIVVNLLGNAIKFSHEGGTVCLRVESTEREILVEVRDQGEGIDPALLPDLFQRFKQADSSIRRRHGGLGLGLSIVRHLVAAHGGRVAAESDGLGRGAVFRVRFPRPGAVELRALTPPPPADEAPPASLVGIRVLGIDDDADARDTLALALIGCGATVSLASSAAEALERLRVEVPDIILTDLAMPEVDGLDLAERIRTSANPRIRALPIIAITAHASAKDRLNVLGAGLEAYVAKPYEQAALSRLIIKVIHAKLTGQ